MGGVELTPAGSIGMEGRRKTPARSRTSAIRAAKLASSAWMESACRTCSMPMATAFRRTATVTTPTRPSDRRRSESARTTVESAASFAPTEFGTPAMRRLRASARSDRSRGWFHACDAVSASSRASTGRGRSRVSAPGWEPARRAKRITARSPAASAAKERRCRSGPVVRTARGEAGCRWARARPTRSARRARRIRRPARARAGVEGRSPARGPAIRAPAAGTRGAPGADARPVARSVGTESARAGRRARAAPTVATATAGRERTATRAPACPRRPGGVSTARGWVVTSASSAVTGSGPTSTSTRATARRAAVRSPCPAARPVIPARDVHRGAGATSCMLSPQEGS